MLSVVGGTLVLGKPFQLICHSENGTLPIAYSLWGPKKTVQVKVVNKPGERAIFNTSAINAATDISNFLCHASNNQHRKVEPAQVQRWTNIIGASDAPTRTAHSKASTRPRHNLCSPCRARVETSAAHSSQHGGRLRGAAGDSSVLCSGRHTSCQLHLVPHQDGWLSCIQDFHGTRGVPQDSQHQERTPGRILLCEHQPGQ